MVALRWGPQRTRTDVPPGLWPLFLVVVRMVPGADAENVALPAHHVASTPITKFLHRTWRPDRRWPSVPPSRSVSR